MKAPRKPDTESEIETLSRFLADELIRKAPRNGKWFRYQVSIRLPHGITGLAVANSECLPAPGESTVKP